MQERNKVSGSTRKELRKERSHIRILIRDFRKDYEKDMELHSSYGLSIAFPHDSYEKQYSILIKMLNNINDKIK